MKYLAILLSCYMLLLALLPCGDEVECMDDERYETAFTGNDHQDHDNHTENCSPFCICACCGQVLHVFSAYHFELKPALITTNCLFSDSDPYFEVIASSIWQPPKLV